VAFSIARSDGVTTVSGSLRESTIRELGITRDIRVIPNFLDCDAYHRVGMPALRRRFCGDDPDATLIIHVSNFRPVKRVHAVLDVFDMVRKRLNAHLLLVGDGPELGTAHRIVRERQLSGRVHAVGTQEEVVPLLSISDLFLLPSAQESFGLAALEAMACEVPVVASRVGGLPEVIEDGVSGFLHPPDALADMADTAVALLSDAPRRAAVARASRQRVLERFCAHDIVPMYEAFYAEVLDRPPQTHER
jgi:N-acetyl-alpha-D-glucosaminyl L-malate synthase BshA